MFFIILDVRQGYHQILVRLQNRKKLAFFTPDGKKKTFRVMSFSPKNVLEFYTAMMKKFQEGEMRTSITQLSTQQTQRRFSMTYCTPDRHPSGQYMVVESLLMLSFHMKPKFTNFSVTSRVWQMFSSSIGCHLN